MAFRFRKFEVYTEIKDFIGFVLRLTKKFPNYLKFSLGTQINNAVISILLNFAEGSDRGSDQEFKRFLNISIASLNEVVGGFEIALDDKIITAVEFEEMMKRAEIIVKRLSSLKKSLKKP